MISRDALERHKMADSGPMPKTPRRTEVSMSIRVRPDVAEEVRANAAAARRSLNREVELYIEEALERRRRARAQEQQQDDRPPG
jgi:predicted HicB family RNase H-like nuclease